MLKGGGEMEEIYKRPGNKDFMNDGSCLFCFSNWEGDLVLWENVYRLAYGDYALLTFDLMIDYRFVCVEC